MTRTGTVQSSKKERIDSEREKGRHKEMDRKVSPNGKPSKEKRNLKVGL